MTEGFSCGGRREDHLPRANLKHEWPYLRWHLRKVSESGDEKADARFDVDHRQAPPQLAPGPQLSGFQCMRNRGRGAQELNAGPQRDRRNQGAGFERGARVFERQTRDVAQHTGETLTLSRTLDRTQSLVDFSLERKLSGA